MTNGNSDILRELEAWYGRKNGDYLLSAVRKRLQSSLDTAFGYHILQLGMTRIHPLFENSPIHHRVYCAERAGGQIGLVADCEELPLESDSIDILIAHHSLEFDANPHQALREMQRVVAPQGHLIIVGFNPYSASGAAAYLRGLWGNSPWSCHQAVSAQRLADWLHLLGCEVESRSYVCSLPPTGGGRFREAMERCDTWLNGHNVPLGGLYVLHAVKQVSGINRPRRKLMASGGRLIGLAVPKPQVAPNPTPSVPTHRNGDVAA